MCGCTQSLNYFFALENIKKLPSKVGYFTKTEEFFLYCSDCRPNGQKLQFYVGNLAQDTSVYYFVGKMKRSKSCEKCIFLPRRGAAWAWCVVLRQPCTVAVFVRNCPKNKVSFQGVAALWVDCMPFPADQEQWVISNRFILETNSKRFAIRERP